MLVVASMFVASASGILPACAGGDDREVVDAADAAGDAPRFGDASEPVTDAEPLPSDPCGPAGGLQVGAPWPLRGGCATRAGWSPLPGPQGAAITASVSLGAGQTSPAVSATNLVWVGTEAGDIVAVSSGGALQWVHHTTAPVRSSPAIDIDGHAIIGGGDGFLRAIAPAARDVASDADAGEPDAAPSDAGLLDGGETTLAKVVFSLAVGPIASSPVIGPDGTIYVGTTSGKLVAVFGNGSAVKWTVDTGDAFGSSPALGRDGTVYVGSTDEKLRAVRSDGTPEWALDLGSPIHGSPAIGGDGVVYVGTIDGKLHAVAASGIEQWAYATGGPITGAPAVYGGTVYVGSEDEALHAVRASDGLARWTYATTGAVGTPVIDGSGTIYVGSTDARVYAITPKGSLYFAVNVKGAVTSAPAIGVGGTLYVTTANALVVVGP